MTQQITFKDFIKKHLDSLQDKSSYKKNEIDWYEKTYKEKDYAKNFFSQIKESDPELYANLESLHSEYKCLNRRQVFDLLNQEGNEYPGFIAVMVWGGLGTGLSKNDSFSTILSSQNKPSIETKIKSIKDILSKSDRAWKEKVEEAYTSLNTGKNKIDGISTSYFTKILYFLTFENQEFTPLIFDNQSKRIHAALLKDDNALSGKYAIGYDRKGNFYCNQEDERKSNWKEFDFYWDYMTRMKSIADEYFIESGRLEEILFEKKLNSEGGRDKDKNGVPKWPRWFVRQYIDSNVRRRVKSQDANQGDQIDKSAFGKLAEDWYHSHGDIGKINRDDAAESKILIEVPIQGNQVLRLGYRKTFYFCGIYNPKTKTNLQEYPELLEKREDKGIIVGRYFKDKNKTKKSFELFNKLYDRYK